MRIISKEPVYRLKDERFSMALSCDNDLGSFINVYFVNVSSEDIKSLKVQGTQCSLGREAGDDKILSVVERQYVYIPPEKYILLTQINALCYEWDEYILNFTIITGREKVIAEYTVSKGNFLTGNFNDYICIINKKGKMLSLESRSFAFTD